MESEKRPRGRPKKSSLPKGPPIESVEDLLGVPPKSDGKGDLLPPALLASAPITKALSKLNPKQVKFVTNLIGGMSQAEALLAAGWECSRDAARGLGSRLANSPAVKEAMELIKAELVKKAEYSFDAFMTEMNDAIQFAKVTRNATALVRAVELKGKASGHIVERVDQRNINAGFQVQIAGIDDPPPAKVVSRG